MSKIKKKNRFYGPLLYGFQVTPSDALWFTPRILHQMKGLIKLRNPDKFIEDSSFGSHFRDLQKLA